MSKKIAICGAGTMGSGIALVCARAGFDTLLFDLQAGALAKAETANKLFLEQQLNKGRIDAATMNATLEKLAYSADPNEVRADIIIEAIVEQMPAKIALFSQLAAQNSDGAIFASNTSSLSVSTLASALPHPERVAGLHFFNPAPLMKLVEVVKGNATSEAVMETLVTFTQQLGKTPVVCKDAPGFIVNRVARHYYLEALRIAEQTNTSFETIDAALENAGFKMGPFRLMDMIGNDVNFAVTTSLYEACGNAPRFQPSPIQAEKVRNNELGRKTGKGYYAY
ncbi:3-hydroxyacyl-CoA dehydrogenase family protein [Parasegetibacter sp. NRK P23]|uniref:3-hydroxyacyl-CoA dehydrogenase family protein n=1 Tax=Parasegetibacter sp. NRK P23 TaxID=2942999 RepID=UPI00204461EB|nr:3-hydroxyacyl-CoA dehydrogenase NAD-binding domain-containing protein [Parasegetibacter sp. NRK P23]MCM5529437.1 3-hydroxyacyl-CoA dehydrogenase NAD-binding domain-containing protein [Parasegetibacter sp. NRK P23]